MISKNLPVICLYNSNSSSDSLILYSSAERAIDNERLYSGDDYCITFSILSTWEGGYNLAVTINNTGNTPIEKVKL